MSKPQAPTIWRLTGTMKANSPANSIFILTINMPNVFGGEVQDTKVLLNVPYIIVDGYISSTISPDAQIGVVANDVVKVWSNKLNDTLVQTGRPRIPLFKKPLYVRPNTKLQFVLRNIDAVGASDVPVTIYLQVEFP